MKILITGASGQLGYCLRNSLKSHNLIALNHSDLDITQPSQIHQMFTRVSPDLIINAAAFNDVDGAESRRGEAYAVNACGPRNLAFEAAELGIPIVHVSTDFVFDGALKRPYDENDRTNPLSLYGASKLAGERAVQMFNPRHYIVRTAWLYWELGKGFLPSMCANASRPELRATDDEIGSPTYAPHLADAIARLIETDTFGIYHIAGSGGASRWEFVTEAFRRLGITTPVRPVSYREFPSAANRPTYSVLTSVQHPRVTLPPWQEGVAEFANRLGMHTGEATARQH
jgi:dTDP-4-dehydrorhamnose reductase